MDSRQDLTKELLAGCFKELMLTRPFEKITIKNITDKAGLIRPTYYKHFQDKYELLEWIFLNEIGNQAELLVENDMLMEALVLVAKGLDRDKVYYKKAFKIPGPNSFCDVFQEYLYRIFLKIIKKYSTSETYPGYATPERAARYFMHGLVHLFEDWLFDPNACRPEDFCRYYKFLVWEITSHFKAR